MEHTVWSFLISSVLFFAYNTDVFVQYVSLFRLGRLFKVDEYQKHQGTFPDNTYWDFLVFERPNFLTKLISCPICASFWLNLACFSYHRDLVTLIVNIWMTLFLYFLLCVMLKKSYE